MIIAAEGLAKVFLTEEVKTTALQDVRLSIDEGEFVSLMGPSGCGKSTLMHILGLIDNPSSGSYKFLGEEVADYSESRLAKIRKANIGFVFQSFNLIDELTVFENVELPLIYNGTPRDERSNRVAEVLDRMDMSHRMKHFPLQLSGGQQQRAAVARALVNEPKLILADEPTGNLDTKHGDDVMNILRQLNEDGASIVMVTHSEYDAGFAGRTVHLVDGKVQSR